MNLTSVTGVIGHEPMARLWEDDRGKSTYQNPFMSPPLLEDNVPRRIEADLTISTSLSSLS
jgi:hypothetical protein